MSNKCAYIKFGKVEAFYFNWTLIESNHRTRITAGTC